MRVSWKWLQELVDLSGTSLSTPEALGEFLTSRGLEVEEIARQDAGFEKVVAVKILRRDPHPQADRLSLCSVTTGSGDPIEIVCGAQNMKAGDIVPLAQVGAHLPNGLKIAAGKIRGVVSNGMLCSEEELGLAKESEGLLILPPATEVGKPMALILGRDDVILTLKLTANRADCLSHWGLAREIAAGTSAKLRRPEGVTLDSILHSGRKSPIAVQLEAGELAPQFWGVAIEGVKVGPSPEWVKRRLEALGSRSINNVVDATNLVMLELGHPLHAYDATRLQGSVIRVREARAGETLPLLDGTEAKMTGGELVIADAERAVGLAGVMGGGNSEVQDATTSLFLEAAEFAASNVRRASSRHQKKTEASHRFERGVDPQGVGVAMARLTKLILDWAGGRIVGTEVATLPSREPKLGDRMAAREIRVNAGYFEAFLGLAIAPSDVERILLDLGCRISNGGDEWTVVPPSHRLDLSIPEDLAEEIARTVGYDKIPATIPVLTGRPISRASDPAMAEFELVERAKKSMERSGLLEALNFAFTREAWLDELGLGVEKLRVLNPLSEDLAVMTPSLLPGLLDNVRHNWNHHFGSDELAVRLFELRPTFRLAASQDGKVQAKGELETGTTEPWKLAFAVTGPKFAGGLKNDFEAVDFADVKAMVERLFDDLGTRGVRLLPLSETRTPDRAGVGLFHPGQSVEVIAGNTVAGTFGLLHPKFARGWKARTPLWIGEFDWTAIRKLSRAAGEVRTFKAWPQFPSMERDFALLVDRATPADKLVQVAVKAGRPLAKQARVFDVYQGAQVPEGKKSVALRVTFADDARSLTDAEAEGASQKIVEAFRKELGAELRG